MRIKYILRPWRASRQQKYISDVDIEKSFSDVSAVVCQKKHYKRCWRAFCNISASETAGAMPAHIPCAHMAPSAKKRNRADVPALSHVLNIDLMPTGGGRRWQFVDDQHEKHVAGILALNDQS